MVAAGQGGADGLLAFGLGARVLGRAAGIRADRGHLDQGFDPGFGRQAGDAAGAFGLDAGEIAGAAFGQDADEVDDDAGAFHGAGDAAVLADIAEQGHHLADAAHGLEVHGGFRVPHGDADDVAGCGEALDDVAAQEARSAHDSRDGGCLHALVSGLEGRPGRRPGHARAAWAPGPFT